MIYLSISEFFIYNGYKLYQALNKEPLKNKKMPRSFPMIYRNYLGFFYTIV